MLKEIPKFNTEIFALISELARALRCCQQEAVFCENVTLSQFLILDNVSSSGKLRLSDLHKILSVEKSTTTRLVDPLVRQGLIKRERSEFDSRVIELSLTVEGKSVRNKVWECLSEFLGKISSGIPKSSKAEVLESVRIFTNAMQDACSNGKCKNEQCTGENSNE